MAGWWRRDPFFMRYMVREATAVAVLAYAVVLCVGVVRLSQGEAAWRGWVAALQAPWSVLLHLVLLVAFAVHAKSWFEIMPKTMPALFMHGRRVAASTITRCGWALAAVASVVVLALATWATA
jgi:fumarate reductase subunit C